MMGGIRPGESVSGWILEQMIGQGTFATVWKARKTVKGSVKVAAVKAIATDRLMPKLRQNLGSEVSILKRVVHVNVVKLHEVVEMGRWIFLVMEFCGGGDLAGYIRGHPQISEATARHFVQQLGHGLKEMWLNNFVHRDLKPHNLLLQDKGERPALKIADFGFARNLQPQGLADTLCGSPMYMAPEILQGNRYDAKADLWSVGVILYELVVGRPPFDGAHHVALLQNIQKKEARIPDHRACRLSAECIDLITKLLKKGAIERMSFTEFFAHPFLGSGELSPPGTVRSGTSSHSQGSSEQLPFSMDPLGPSSNSSTRVSRTLSAPATPVAPQILVVPRSQQLRVSGSGEKRSSQHLEDDDDYVIIERSQSALGASGSRSPPHLPGQRSRSIWIPPPPSMVVPLISASVVPPSSMAKSLAGVKFTSGVPRGEALKQVAFLLEDLGSSRQQAKALAESLVFRLLALQVLEAATHCSPPCLTQADSGESSNTELATSPKSSSLKSYMKSITERAVQVSGQLQKDGMKRPLPDVWDLAFKAALGLAKGAAVDELFNNYQSALKAYSKAGALLYFIFAEGSELPLEPKLVLSPADTIRLQRYTASIAIRHQDCLARLKGPKQGRAVRAANSRLKPILAISTDQLMMSVSKQTLRKEGRP